MLSSLGQMGLSNLPLTCSYLSRFQGLILTACGLGMGSASSSLTSRGSDEDDGTEFESVTSMSSPLRPAMSEYDEAGRRRSWLLTSC